MKTLEKYNFSIMRQTKGDIPTLPFLKVKEYILGKEYDLSLSFVDEETMESLSLTHKKSKDHMNTLAFSLDTNSGEIVMNLATIRMQAKDYNKTYLEFLLYLFIHSSLHLKGHTHSDKMDKEEDRIFTLFNK